MDQGNEIAQFLDGEKAIWIQESIMSYLHKSSWQHMLKEPSDKFHSLKGHSFPCFPLPVFIGKLNRIIFNVLNAVIGNGYTKDIPGQVPQ